jgi:hypothetical protein
MSRAVVVGLAARTALLSVFQYAHTGVKEATNLWLRSLIGSIGCNFYYGTSLNLVGAEYAELDSEDRLNLRITTGGHL